MEISINLFSDFVRYHSPPKFKMELMEERSVLEVLKSLKISENLPKLILVNGKVVTDQTMLKDGDTLSAFSPVAGG